MGRLEGERSENDEARRLFLEEGDISGALKLMQRYLTAERALLEVSHPRSHPDKPPDSFPEYAHIGNDLCQMSRNLATRCSPLRVNQSSGLFHILALSSVMIQAEQY